MAAAASPEIYVERQGGGVVMPGGHHFLPHAQGRLITSQGCVKSATFVCALVPSRRPWLHRSRNSARSSVLLLQAPTHAAVATYGICSKHAVPAGKQPSRKVFETASSSCGAEQTKPPSSARTDRKEQAMPADWANASVSEPQRPP
jgi:hypothetical protein